MEIPYKFNTITCTVPRYSCKQIEKSLSEVYSDIISIATNHGVSVLDNKTWGIGRALMKLKYNNVVITMSSNGYPHIVGGRGMEDILDVLSCIRKIYLACGLEVPIHEPCADDIEFHMLNCSRELVLKGSLSDIVKNAHSRGMHAVYDSLYTTNAVIYYYINDTNSGQCNCPDKIHVKRYASKCNRVSFTVYSTGAVLCIAGNVTPASFVTACHSVEKAISL